MEQIKGWTRVLRGMSPLGGDRGGYFSPPLITECPILFSCLNVVALITRRLPVAFIPEQVVIASMRNDMVH